MPTNIVSAEGKPPSASMVSGLHIVVGVAPNSGGIGEDLRLLKAALLYADSVRLCSPTASILMNASQFAWLDERARSRFLLRMAEEVNDPQFQAQLATYRRLERARRLSKSELLLRMEAKEIIDRLTKKLAAQIVEHVARSGGEGLHEALTSGVVELEHIDTTDATAATLRYFEIVRDSVANGQAYPLLDEKTNELVRLAIQSGSLKTSLSAERLGRIAGVAADVLSRLPLFEQAHVNEILQLREDLQAPLQRFRGAITGYSLQIAPAQWDESFPLESELIFRQEIAPVVADLEEEIEANTLARHLRKRISSPLKESALGVIVGQLTHFADITGLGSAAVGLSASAVSLTLSAIQDWREKTAAVERNQLYFYVAAGQRFRSTS